MKEEGKALSWFYEEATKCKPLPRKEQLELIKKAQKGDKLAMDKLIRSNLRFIIKIAHKQAAKYPNSAISLSDLISEGIMGFIEGVKRFDISKNVTPLTYIGYWIKIYISKLFNTSIKETECFLDDLEGVEPSCEHDYYFDESDPLETWMKLWLKKHKIKNNKELKKTIKIVCKCDSSLSSSISVYSERQKEISFSSSPISCFPASKTFKEIILYPNKNVYIKKINLFLKLPFSPRIVKAGGVLGNMTISYLSGLC